MMEDDKKTGSGIDLKKMQDSLDITLANFTPKKFKAWLKSRGLENKPPLTIQQFVDEYGNVLPVQTLEKLKKLFSEE